MDNNELPADLANPKMSPAQYWEWRATLAELKAARLKQELNEAKVQFLQKVVEISSVKAQLFSATELRASREDLDANKSEYQRFKNEIEESVGTSLENKIVDDLTFEIKPLPETSNAGEK